MDHYGTLLQQSTNKIQFPIATSSSKVTTCEQLDNCNLYILHNCGLLYNSHGAEISSSDASERNEGDDSQHDKLPPLLL